MIRCRHALVFAGLLVGACERSDDPETSGRPEGDTPSARTADRFERPLSEEPPPTPRERLADALGLEDPAERERKLEALAWDALELEPEVARQALDELPPGSPGARRLIGHFAMRLADDDVEAAVSWAQDFEDPGERAEAFGRLALVLANEDPERAATLVVTEMPAGRPRDRAVVQVVQRWAQQDAPAAGDWISSFPAGAARRAGIRELLNYWLPRRPDDAAAWVHQLGTPELVDEALEVVAELPARSRELFHARDPDTPAVGKE